MSREIKFRAWDKSNKKFRHYQVPRILGCWDLETLDCGFQLYTGLHDKNGKEIYEGDIIRYFAGALGKEKEDECLYIIEWNNKWASFDYWCPELGDWRDSRTYLPRSREIIGNIYENPELLKDYDLPNS